MKIYLPGIDRKRADMSVVVFVVLVLTLCIYTLYVIAANKTRVTENLIGYDSPEKMLLQQKELDYRLAKLGEECFISNINGPDIVYIDIDGWIADRSGERLQESMSKCIKDIANEHNNFLKEEEKKDPSELYNHLVASDFSMLRLKDLRKFYDTLIENNIGVLHIGDYIVIIVGDYSLNEEEGKYNFGLSTQIDLERMGFFNPEKIKEVCKYTNEEDAEKYSKGIFDVEIEEIKDDEENYYIYTLTTNKKFLIDGELRIIVLRFYVDHEGN